jgi:hypothetical protein
MYRELCELEDSIPLFSQAWWLDAVAGDTWDVSVVEKGGTLVAAMPYLLRHRYGLKVITQPKLTQNLGPWIKSNNAKYAKRLAHEKDLMQALIKNLPVYDHFAQSWHHKQTNWLPFYWHGFTQTTAYTYRIENLQELKSDDIWKLLNQNIRTDIRKASNREKLKVRDDLPMEDFIKLNNMVFKRQGLEKPYGVALLKNIEHAAASRNQRKIFIAEDGEGKQHAGVYIIWDDNSAYYLLGGGNPELRNSGATSLCMWEAIKFASTVTKSFDFEGSMIEPIERFFRGFGARQTPYHRVSHTPSRILRGVRGMKEFFG